MAETAPVDYGAQVDSVEPTTKERILKGIGGAVAGATGASSAGLDAAIEKHQQARLSEARMHRQNASTYAGILASGHHPTLTDANGNPLPLSTVDPKTGRTYEDEYQNWYDSAMAAYKKAAGVNKETKGAIAKAEAIAQHIIGLGRKQREQGGQGGAGGTGAQPAGLLPPPQRSGTEQVGPGGGLPLPEGTVGGGLTPPPGYTPQVAMAGGELAQQVEDNRKLANYKKMQQILYDEKVREDAAKAKAKQQNTPRPVKSNAISVLDARTLAEAGKIFEDGDGNAIDVNSLPKTMGLISFVVKDIDTGEWKTVYQPFSPNQADVTIGKYSFAINRMDLSKLPQGEGVELGPKETPTTTRTTDPTTGQTTVSTRTPTISGIPGRPGTGGITAPPAAAPHTGKPSAQRPSGATAPGRPTASAIPTDADGHIDPSWSGATPQVIEAANQLIDDRDVDKIPTKVRELGAALARKTGWFQGKFNPQQVGQMRNTVGFLDDFSKSPSLSVLDDEMSRLKLIPILSASSGKAGTTTKIASEIASKRMTPTEAEFVRQYNITAQALAGMASFTRGGNKATEAAINRLLTDLPNVMTSRNSEDGRKRLNLLLLEAQRILQKGQIQAKDVPGGSSKKFPGPKDSSASSAPQRQRWGRDANNNPVPLPASP